MTLLQLMVRLIEELSMMNVPIVFKGAVVLKTALAGYPLNTERSTRDMALLHFVLIRKSSAISPISTINITT